MANIIIDRKNETLTISKAFEREANEYGSKAYKQLEKACAALPNYTVHVESSRRTSPNKNLNYKRMEDYLTELKGEGSKELLEFKKIQRLAQIQRSPYTYVRDWFLSEYPAAREAVQVKDEIASNHKPAELLAVS